MKLSEQEARVLGCLIEKNQATPEYYPLTLNALVTACNQKTSRSPVVNYSEEEVEDALVQLIEKGLCTYVTGSGRAVKYRHRCGASGLSLSDAQVAALSIMLLRGSQTAGEIKGRSTRQFDFASLEMVEETLASLMQGDTPYVEQAPRRAGQKEVRYRHLFYDYDDLDPGEDESETINVSAAPSLRDEVVVLKRTVAELQKDNVELREQVAALRVEIEKIKNDLY